MDVDEAFLQIGELGKRQLFYVVIISLGHLASAFQMVLLVFVGAEARIGCSTEDEADLVVVDPTKVFKLIKSGQCTKQHNLDNTGIFSIANEVNFFALSITWHFN